jgi:hypothetical protein
LSDLEPDWVTAFRNVILELDTVISEFLHDEPSPEEAAAALVAFNRAKMEVGMAYDYLARIVSDIMENEVEISLPDGSRVEKKWSNSRTGWQHKDLASVVARRIVDLNVDMDTGEVIATPEELVGQILDFVQPSYWRIKELQRIGVDADRYCEVKEAKSSIIVRKASS